MIGGLFAHLESLFRQHGAPLFLKRDNGSPFNCQPVDEVMARFGVLPLNNPPHFPRYNGAQEKSIRDLKTALYQRMQCAANVPKDFALAVEVTTHDLNHRSRRCLKGLTACAVFHDDAQTPPLDQTPAPTRVRTSTPSMMRSACLFPARTISGNCSRSDFRVAAGVRRL
jgi:hypothetical protein